MPQEISGQLPFHLLHVDDVTQVPAYRFEHHEYIDEKTLKKISTIKDEVLNLLKDLSGCADPQEIKWKTRMDQDGPTNFYKGKLEEMAQLIPNSMQPVFENFQFDLNKWSTRLFVNNSLMQRDLEEDRALTDTIIVKAYLYRKCENIFSAFMCGLYKEPPFSGSKLPTEM